MLDFLRQLGAQVHGHLASLGPKAAQLRDRLSDTLGRFAFGRMRALRQSLLRLAQLLLDAQQRGLKAITEFNDGFAHGVLLGRRRNSGLSSIARP
jgi:hypothetical protein